MRSTERVVAGLVASALVFGAAPVVRAEERSIAPADRTLLLVVDVAILAASATAIVGGIATAALADRCVAEDASGCVARRSLTGEGAVLSVATVGLGVVGAAIGVWLLGDVLSLSERREWALAPWVGPDGAGTAFSISF